MQFPVFPSSSVKEKPNHFPDLDTTLLWREFKEGSELAFTAIYKKHVNSLYHYGERLTRHKELIEDSIHDFFVELWKQRENYGKLSK